MINYKGIKLNFCRFSTAVVVWDGSEKSDEIIDKKFIFIYGLSVLLPVKFSFGFDMS